MYSKNSIKLNVIINNVYYVPTVKSTNECVVIIKKYLYCKYVIMYSKKSNVSTVESCPAMY